MSSAKGSAMSYVTGEKIKGDLALWFEQAHGSILRAPEEDLCGGLFHCFIPETRESNICQHIWHNIKLTTIRIGVLLSRGLSAWREHSVITWKRDIRNGQVILPGFDFGQMPG